MKWENRVWWIGRGRRATYFEAAMTGDMIRLKTVANVEAKGGLPHGPKAHEQ